MAWQVGYEQYMKTHSTLQEVGQYYPKIWQERYEQKQLAAKQMKTDVHRNIGGQAAYRAQFAQEHEAEKRASYNKGAKQAHAAFMDSYRAQFVAQMPSEPTVDARTLQELRDAQSELTDLRRRLVESKNSGKQMVVDTVPETTWYRSLGDDPRIDQTRADRSAKRRKISPAPPPVLLVQERPRESQNYVPLLVGACILTFIIVSST